MDTRLGPITKQCRSFGKSPTLQDGNEVVNVVAINGADVVQSQLLKESGA